MTAAHAVLRELRARGVRAFPRGDRLRLEPLEALTPDLIERARAVRDELLAIVAGTAPRAADPGPYGYGRCFRCGRDLPDGVEIAECPACRAARGEAPVASGPPVALLDPGEPAQPAYPLRVVVDAFEPVAGPVELRPGVRAVDVPRAIEAMLADLERLGCRARVVAPC